MPLPGAASVEVATSSARWCLPQPSHPHFFGALPLQRGGRRIWIFGILLVVSPRPCMSIGPRDVKQGALHCRCFLDHLRTPCRNVVIKTAFSFIQILLHSLVLPNVQFLVDHWYFLSAVGTWFHRAAVGHFLQDHYRWKALTCPLTLWKPILKTCCLTSFWSSGLDAFARSSRCSGIESWAHLGTFWKSTQKLLHR